MIKGKLYPKMLIPQNNIYIKNGVLFKIIKFIQAGKINSFIRNDVHDLQEICNKRLNETGAQ